MTLLHVVSFTLLVIAVGWFAFVVRWSKDMGLRFMAIAAGFITLHELLQLLAIPGVGPLSTPERVLSREVPVRLFALLMVYFIGRSLHKRMQLEEQLRLGDLTYKGVFDAASDSILVIDRQSFLITDINRAGCEKYGYSREELLGKPIAILSADPEKTNGSIDNQITHIPFRLHRTKEGIEFPVEVISSFFSQSGNAYVVSVIRDISERVRIEQQMSNRETQLKRHNEALATLSKSTIWRRLGVQASLEQVTEVAAQALDLDRVSIWLFNQDRTKIVCQDLYERQIEEHNNSLELFAKDYPAYFVALEQDRTIAAHDAHTDSRTKEFSVNYLTPLGITSMLDAPIRILGNNVGVVCHEHIGKLRQWSPEEEAFAASIADFVAMSIEAEESQKTRMTMDRLVEVLQLTPDFVGVTKLDGHSPFMNHGGRKMLGIDDSENIADLQAKDFLPDRAWKFYREEVLPLVMIDGVWEGENSLKRRNGEELTVSQVIIAHRNGTGKIEYLSTIMRDISAQKLAEQALRQSEERYRALYEDNPTMYFTVDATGIVLSVNRYGAEHLGYKQRELIGKSVLVVFDDEDKAAVTERLKACLQTPDKIVEWEFRKRHRDGSLMWVREFVRVLQDSNGKSVVLVVCEDITERKKAEEEIHKLNSGLKDSTEQMRRLAAHLQSVREQERKRISMEIHDELGQQLTNFKFELKRCAVEAGKQSPEMANKAESLSEQVSGMMKTVRRIATELRPGILDELGLSAAIEWQTQEFRRITQIPALLHKTVEDIPIDDDRATAVFRIFQEMLTNIARHSEATKVDIRLDCDNSLLVLQVKDNGKGATENRLKNSRSLGVLGMRERAQVFGGTLTIGGADGKGTTAVLEMPLS